MENWNFRWWNLLFIVFRGLSFINYSRVQTFKNFSFDVRIPKVVPLKEAKQDDGNFQFILGKLDQTRKFSQVNLCLLITFFGHGMKIFNERCPTWNFFSGLSLFFVLKFVENFLIDCSFIGNQWTWTIKRFSDFCQILFKK